NRHRHTFPTRRSSDLTRRLKPLATVIAQSVGTPGGEMEKQLLQPRSAQFLAGEVTSGLRIKVFRAKVKLNVFTTPGLKIWVSFRSEEHTSELQSPYDL